MIRNQNCGDTASFGLSENDRVSPPCEFGEQELCYDLGIEEDDLLPCDSGGYFHCDGSGLFEPPKLPLGQQIKLSRALERKDQLASTVHQFQSGLERVEKELTQVKTQIELMLEEQSCLQEVMDSSGGDQAQIGLISAEKLKSHKRLIELIHREDSLLAELEVTRRSLSSANINNQSYALGMRDKIDEIQRIHTQRKDFEFNCRLGREKAIRRNAAMRKRREIEESETAREKYLLEKAAAAGPKPKIGKETVEKLRSLRNQTLERLATAKRLSAEEEEVRRARQKNNLLHLKRELDEQREFFLAANTLRKERAREVEKVTMRTRQEIMAAGGNPFLLERLAAQEKNERLKRKKRAAEEEETMKRYTEKCLQDQQSEKRRLKLRQTLEELWAAKALEKRMVTRRTEQNYWEEINAPGRANCEFSLEVNEIEKELFNVDLLMEQNSKQGGTDLFLQGEEQERNSDQSETFSKSTPSTQNMFLRFIPDEIVFKDFELYKSYRKKVTVANRSNQRLRFFLREFEDLGNNTTTVGTSGKPRIKDVVKVSLDTPPPLSPGLTHEFYLTFSPKTLDSWEGHLHFESPVGPFFLPVKCLQKQFEPTLSTGLVTFRNVVLGTTGVAKVKLVNRGTLSGIVTQVKESVDQPDLAPAPDPPENSLEILNHGIDPVSSKSGRRKSKSGGRNKGGINQTPPPPPPSPVSRITHGDLSKSQDDDLERSESGGSKRESGGKQGKNETTPTPSTVDDFVIDLPRIFGVMIEESTDRLLPNGELTLKVTYTPQVPGNHSSSYEIHFENPDIIPLKLDIEGTCTENPFTATPLNTNMNICLMNMTYQQPIEIRNLSKGAGKIIPRVHSLLSPFVEVAPKSGAPSLPGTANLFSVKFTPKLEIQEDQKMTQFYDHISRIMDFPISFTFEGFSFAMPGPLDCTFQAILDDPEILLSPRSIDFGLCFTSETVRKRIEIKSLAAVATHFGFVELPDWVSVQPNYGFGTLLPGESRMIDILVSLTPTMVGKQRVTLKLRTLEKKELTLSIKVFGTLPTTAFTVSHISFPVTSIGSSIAAITEIYIKGTQSKSKGMAGNRGNRSKFGPVSTVSAVQFKFLVDETFPVDISPSSGIIQPGKREKILVTLTAELSEETIQSHILSHFQILLQQKFEKNLENIQLELTSVNELLAKFGPATPKTGTANEEREEVKAHRPKSKGHQELKRKESNSARTPPSVTRKLSSPLKSSRTSLTKHRSSWVIRTFDDLQLIASDGKVLVAHNANQARELELRKQFLTGALKATLDPSDQPPTSIGPLDYARIRRDLIQNFPTKVYTYTIPCSFTLGDGKEEVHFLTLRCPMQKPDLIILEGVPDVHFGGVPVGKEVIKEVNLYNTSIGTLDLKMDGVNPYGVFARVNALRRLAPNLVFTLRLKFTPKAQEIYKESVTVYAGESRITLKLIGEGQ